MAGLSELPVPIIGAGLFGLSVAAHLRSRDVPFRIVGTPMLIRSLARLGIPVYTAAEDHLTPAGISRHLAGSFVWNAGHLPTIDRGSIDRQFAAPQTHRDGRASGLLLERAAAQWTILATSLLPIPIQLLRIPIQRPGMYTFNRR
jgi:hypothetical protein